MNIASKGVLNAPGAKRIGGGPCTRRNFSRVQLVRGNRESAEVPKMDKFW